MSDLICERCNVRDCECVPYDVECDSCIRAYKQGKADREKELSELPNEYSEKLWKLAYSRGRTDAIDEFKTDIINKIDFEEKWLMNCKSNNADTNIVFSALKTFANNRAEQLKEQK